MSQLSLYNVLLKPHVTEKTSQVSGTKRQYVFKVAISSNKKMIKTAVEQLFSVKVNSVTVANVKPEPVRIGKSRVTRKAWKKAYITLEQGQEIDVAAA
jgi:large subunit ribosomal protein L23